jgi:hypothetical protein
MSDFNNLLQQFEKLANAVFLNENKRFVVSSILPRFKQAADQNRNDLTINQATFVLEKVADSDPLREVSSKELNELGNQFYINGTEYFNEFSDLLDKEPQETITAASNRIQYEQQVKDLQYDGSYQKPQELVDPTLSMTPTETLTAKIAVQLIDEELSNTKKVLRSQSILKQKSPTEYIFKTTIRTAEVGDLDLIIPVEIKNNAPLFPQVVATTEKVYTLDQSGIEDLIVDKTAEANFKKANHISTLRSTQDFDLSLRNDTMKYATEVSETDFVTENNNKLVRLTDSEIEKTLQDAVVRKASRYTEKAIVAGNQLVTKTLAANGFRGVQVRFAGDIANVGLNYKAEINSEVGKVEIEIPVQIQDNLMVPPTEFSLDQNSYSLTNHNLIASIKQTKTAKVELNPLLCAMSYPELKKQLKLAAHGKNSKIAQQIIEIIDEKFGENYRNSATDDYQVWLEQSVDNCETKCAGCSHYVAKTAQTNGDYCKLLKTAAKNVQKDNVTKICTRSTYAKGDEKIAINNSIKLTGTNWSNND